MRDLFLYIIQVNFLLSLLFLGYYFLLRKLTFYKLNRIYFLVGAGYALLYPFIDFKTLFATSSLPISSETFSVFYGVMGGAPRTSGISLMDILLSVIIFGALIFTIVLIARFKSIYHIHRDSKPGVWEQFPYREVPYRLQPFTFFKSIYLHQKQHSFGKLKTVFKHENIHVEGLHTFDIVVFEILWAMNWFNPLVWQMRKNVRQNLEYLTDQQLLNQGINSRDYQYALVGLAQNNTPRLPGNTFSFKPLKNRIMMMNRKPSSKFQLGKYVFLLPTLVFIGIGFTAALAQDKMEDFTQKVQEKSWTVETAQASQPLLVVNGKTYESGNLNSLNPNSIETINVLKDEPALKKYGDKGQNGVIEVELKEGEKWLPTVSEKSKNNIINNDGKTPLYMLNDKKATPEEVDNLKPEEIESFEVFKDKTALEAYGKEAENGVVKITLKDDNGSARLKLRGKALDDKGKTPIYIVGGKRSTAKAVEDLKPEKIESIEILKDENALETYGEEAKNGVVKITLKEDGRSTTLKNKGVTIFSNNDKTPLYIIDGKKSTAKEAEDLNPDEIESIYVLKDKNSLKKYGKAGQNGVILISLKKK